MSQEYHVPVMLHESVELLNIKPDGVYVDVTFGGGGHSREILKVLGPEGKLVAFDQDPDARRNLIEDDRFVFIPQNFNLLKQYLRIEGIKKVDGILADLGVSSFQFDEAERGFSFRFDADLDMRMNQDAKTTAADLLNTYTAQQLQDCFGFLGEVRNARTLAQEVVTFRGKRKFRYISDLLEMADPLVRGKRNRYLAQLFQALRMEVNDEVGVLKQMLTQTGEVLKTGGRLVVLSYHSIEDRLVKNYMRDGKFETEDDPFDLYGKKDRPFKIITSKAMEASEEEIERNPRARSAKLRVGEKISC